MRYGFAGTAGRRFALLADAELAGFADTRCRDFGPAFFPQEPSAFAAAARRRSSRHSSFEDASTFGGFASHASTAERRYLTAADLLLPNLMNAGPRPSLLQQASVCGSSPSIAATCSRVSRQSVFVSIVRITCAPPFFQPITGY